MGKPYTDASATRRAQMLTLNYLVRTTGLGFGDTIVPQVREYIARVEAARAALDSAESLACDVLYEHRTL